MDNLQLQPLLRDYLTTQSAPVNIRAFVINLIIAAVLAQILSLIYNRFATTISNRSRFSHNFVLITTTTMLIITIVKSSLALSLGLVGALSIVRFRAAIKEPEELAYLFLAISIGLGLGADQRLITIAAFVIISLIIWIKYRRTTSGSDQTVHLIITAPRTKKASLEDISQIITKLQIPAELKRYHSTKNSLEVAFTLELKNLHTLSRLQKQLESLSPQIGVEFIEYKGL